LLLLLYPVGTWGYAKYEQRVLRAELEKSHPLLAREPAAFFTGGMVEVAATSPTPISEERQEDGDALLAEQAQLRAFKDAAQEFAKTGLHAGKPLGKVVIPKIDVESVLIEGTGARDLREGPGHWPETPLPGWGGNFVVSGHRTTYGGPFFRLDKLSPGDEVQILLPYAAIRYEVSRTIIVRPNQVEVVAQRGVEELSLTTCHPIYSARQRLVVQADLVGFKLLQPSPEE
jgi:sortase A